MRSPPSWVAARPDEGPGRPADTPASATAYVDRVPRETPDVPWMQDSLAAWDGHPRGTAGYRRLLVGLFCAGVATFAQLYSPQAMLPQIAAEMHVDAATSALVISAATIGLAIGVLPWSVAADRFGRVRAMSIAIVLATALGMLVPFAPTFPLLLAGRLLEGAMVGGVPVIAIAYLNEEVDAGNTARAAGTYVAGTTIGGLLGRLVAGPVAEVAGWRVGVLCVAFLCAVAAAAFITVAPPSRRFIAGSGGTGLRHRLALNVRSARLLAIYAQGFLLMGGFVALYNYLGFRLIAPPFALPATIVSLIFLAYLGGTWSSAQAGVLSSRFGRLPVLLVSIAIMIAGTLLTLSSSLVGVLAGLVVATAGFFGAQATASGWTGAEATTGRAQASSLYNLFYYGGSSLFGWAGGIFFRLAGWTGMVGFVTTLALVAGGLAAVVLRGRRTAADTVGR
jgi:YNFM family putative membrane transporter